MVLWARRVEKIESPFKPDTRSIVERIRHRHRRGEQACAIERRWKGFDPTNDTVVGSDRSPVAVHSNPEGIPPVSGSFTGPKQVGVEMSVAVQSNQLTEVP